MVKDEWPPKSLDCTPMNHSIWPSLLEKFYRERSFSFKEELKDTIKKKWREILRELVRKSDFVKNVCEQLATNQDVASIIVSIKHVT